MSEEPGSTAVADALSKLQQAMRSPGGSTTRPELRRAALRLSELVRSEDDELTTFAKRHLPSRDVDEDTLKGLRELVIAVSRLVAAQGVSPTARALVGDVRAVLLPRIEEAERPLAPEPPLETAHPPIATATPTPLPHPPSLPLTPSLPQAPSPLQAPAKPPRHASTAPAAIFPAGFAVPPAAPLAVPPAASASAEPVPPPQVPDDAPLVATAELAAPDSMTLSIDDDDAAAQLDAVADTYLPFRRNGKTPSPQSGAVEGRQPEPAADDSSTLASAEPAPTDAAFALPFRKGSTGASAKLPTHLAEIDLKTHTAITALLHVYPERCDWIFSQYGLRDEAERKRLDRHWLTRLSDDSELNAKWLKNRDYLIAHYREKQ